jgi:hypothetical protein
LCFGGTRHDQVTSPILTYRQSSVRATEHTQKLLVYASSTVASRCAQCRWYCCWYCCCAHRRSPQRASAPAATANHRSVLTTARLHSPNVLHGLLLATDIFRPKWSAVRVQLIQLRGTASTKQCGTHSSNLATTWRVKVCHDLLGHDLACKLDLTILLDKFLCLYLICILSICMHFCPSCFYLLCSLSSVGACIPGSTCPSFTNPFVAGPVASWAAPVWCGSWHVHTAR